MYDDDIVITRRNSARESILYLVEIRQNGRRK